MYFYSKGKIAMNVHAQMMLRSKIGTFVGNNGRLFYRCTIESVCKNQIYAIWNGRHAPYDFSGWSPEYRIDMCGLRVMHIQDTELEQFDAHVHGHEYPIWLPYDTKRGDELIFEERYIPNAPILMA